MTMTTTPRSDRATASDLEFSQFLAELQTRVTIAEGARRSLLAERRNIVPMGDRMAREFMSQTEVQRVALRRNQNQSPRAA